KEMHPLLGKKLSLAAINSPSLCVVSGPLDAVAQLEHQLMKQGVSCLRLHTSHAFHSAMMEPILEPFSVHVNTVHLKPPHIPYVSNVTGTWITPAEAMSPSYWVRHLRHTVYFAKGLRELLQDPERILLEVGPGRTLSTFARQHPDKAPEQVVLASLRHSQDQQSDVEFLLHTVGQLWLAGRPVDGSRFYVHERRQRIPLPTYPFERQRYWIEPQKPHQAGNTHKVILRKEPDVTNWFYMPSWQRSLWPPLMTLADLADHKSCWLVFIDACGLGAQIVQRLEQEAGHVITVMGGDRFRRVNDNVYSLNPRQRDDY